MPDIDWDKLRFQYSKVRSNIRYQFKDGKWDNGTLSEDFQINLHIAASCLHYGQECFEGLKACMCKDGKVRIFRPEQNAQRMAATSLFLLGPELPEDLFINACLRVVRDNIDYVPPYGTGGSLYIRPLLIGTSPRIGIAPSDTYELIIMVMPVGPYYKEGITPVDALVMDKFDRAAPHGTGSVKVGGNYAAGLMPAKFAKDRGYPINLFLDSQSHKYIDEFGTSNFIGITEDNVYITPESPSILPSITNKSLLQLAEDAGMKVERRKIPIEELAELKEVGACGTAVVITPISNIAYRDKIYSYGETCGPVLQKLYDALTGIQYGELEDTHKWMLDV
jgi:branched-chain amino acid aminotransferase